MKTSNRRIPEQPPSPPALRLLVLVPHRDTRQQLHAYSASLFAAGLFGAWSFPWVVPLAEIKRPLAGGELKALARPLRDHINLSGGKCIADRPISTALPGSATLSVFGPSLNIEPPGSFFEAVSDTVLCRLSPLVIGAAVVHGQCEMPLPDLPQISFRAAALANMSIRPLAGCGGWDGYSFEWKIGALHWLPKALYCRSP